MSDNRTKRARELAGLSVGQAAAMLGIEQWQLQNLEARTDAAMVGSGDADRMCDVYGVRREWLLGEVPQRDYAAVDEMRGAEVLTLHDRDIIAEFAARIPRGKRRAS